MTTLLGDLKKVGLRFCVCSICVGALLLPVQAAVLVPVPSMKPVKSLELGSLPVDINYVRGGVPVPAVKPNTEYKQQPDKYMKLTDLLSTIVSYAPAAGNPDRDYKDVTSAAHLGDAQISAKQARIYEQIFNAQHYGQWAQADKQIAKLKDKRLLGHVLYQRYMHPSYNSRFDELKAWLASYYDYPSAYNIYKLANAKRYGRPDEINKPTRPRILAQINEPYAYYPKHYVSKIGRTKSQNVQVRKLTRKIHKLVRRGRISYALEYLTSLDPSESIVSHMDKVEIDYLKAEIAAGFLYRGYINKALDLAKEVNERSGKYVPLSSWVVGLALWERQEFTKAAPYFKSVGKSPYASGWKSSAGYYWAARSYSRFGEHKKVRESLEKAASHSRTFYGLIATKMLGKPFDFNWKNPRFTEKQKQLLAATAAGRRAIMLVAAGQYELAEKELMQLDYDQTSGLRRAALNYAMHVGLPGVALRLGNMVTSSDGTYYDSALYPDVPWEPRKGFTLDPSLIYAVMRQESHFDYSAKSNSGAMGLMQIMPRTARYIAQKNRYGHSVNRQALHDPEVNMMVGQDYLAYLMRSKVVQGDMIALLVAYNAGPSNLVKWRKRYESNIKANKLPLSGNKKSMFSDPLLFIETIPIEETRNYIVKVMSNYWIYRLRAGEELVSLSHLMRGQSPRYASFVGKEGKPYKVAKR